jgi:hypothetical protein
VLRSAADAAETGTVRALDLKGLTLGEAPFSLKAADRETEARFDLPVEIRNDIARVEIAGERSAGAVQLLDKRWRRRTVGIVSGATADTSQPLLSSSYYIGRALGPFADVRLAQGESPAEAVTHFLDQNLPMLILADVGNVAGSRAGSRTAACWCVSPGRGSPRPTTISCRSSCGAAAASSAAA